MNRNELIEAIQQVITPNGQKGITAESLANLLIEMVNATPEGGSSGSGSGQVIICFGMPNEEFTEVTLTAEQQAHNAEMFKVIKESPIALIASLDISDFYASMAEMEGISASGCKYCMPCDGLTAYAPKEMATLMGEKEELAYIDSMDSQIYIFSDGSLKLN